MPGYTGEEEKQVPKEIKSEHKLDDGTQIVVLNSHFRQEALAECFEDFPDAIKKIVAPFI
jgi:hypothetical protein